MPELISSFDVPSPTLLGSTVFVPVGPRHGQHAGFFGGPRAPGPASRLVLIAALPFEAEVRKIKIATK